MLSPILGPSPAPKPPRSPWLGFSSQGSPWPFHTPKSTQLPSCFRRTHVASLGSNGTPKFPSEDLCVPQSPSRGCDPSAGPQAPRGPSEILQNSRTLGSLQFFRQNPQPPHRSCRETEPREGHMALSATQSPSEFPIPTKGSQSPRCFPGPPQLDLLPLSQAPHPPTPCRWLPAHHVAGGSAVR